MSYQSLRKLYIESLETQSNREDLLQFWGTIVPVIEYINDQDGKVLNTYMNADGKTLTIIINGYKLYPPVGFRQAVDNLALEVRHLFDDLEDESPRNGPTFYVTEINTLIGGEFLIELNISVVWDCYPKH